MSRAYSTLIGAEIGVINSMLNSKSFACFSIVLEERYNDL